MPIYEYQCRKCGFRFEKLQRLSDPPPAKCPQCAGKIQQLLSPPAVRFKGTGWYATDYARKSAPAAGNGGKPEPKAEAKSEGTKPETGKAEAKSESKPKHRK